MSFRHLEPKEKREALLYTERNDLGFQDLKPVSELMLLIFPVALSI